MTYDFKKFPELYWFLAVAVGPVLAEAAATFDPETITDPRRWAISLFAASIRAVGGAVLGWFAKRRLETPATGG